MEKMMVVLLILLPYVFVFAVWNIWFSIATRKRLKQRQTEWDSIKRKVMKEPDFAGFDLRTRLWDAYADYCHLLWVRDGGHGVGACFPRF